MTRTKRPAKVVVEPVHARPVRGPRPADGRWYWRCEVYQGGKGTGRTIATFWAHRAEVSPLLVEQIAEHGLDRPEEEQPVERVRDLLETWVAAQEARADLSRSRVTSVRNSGKRLCATIGDVFLDRVDATTVAGYRDARLRTDANPKGIASATVQLDLDALAAAWRWGRQLRLVPNFDLPRARVTVTATRDKRTPTRDEILRVLEHLDDAWPRIATVLLFATGARVGEVAPLTWGDLDLTAGVMAIRRGKTGARQVPLHPQVVEALRDWTAEDQRELAAGIYGVTPTMVRSYLRVHLARACEAARVPVFTPHGLRRAAVDALLRSGVDVGTAASFLGHSPQVMLHHYRQATMDDRRKAVALAQLGAFEGGEVLPFPGSSSTGP